MAGTWEKENKILPGAYVNFKANVPLAFTPGDRGCVLMIQNINSGESGKLYTITAERNNWPEGVAAEEKLLTNEALKNAEKVLLYCVSDPEAEADIDAALEAAKTMEFNTLCYPYEKADMQLKIKNWVRQMRDIEGMKCQAVLANYEAKDECVINVVQGVVLADGKTLTAAEVTAWVAGATAGASITQSNTAKKYDGAIDVVPRMTKTMMEDAIEAGKFIFKADHAENVSVVYDINSLTEFTADKSEVFAKNRVLRTLDNINNDIVTIFESNYIGKTDNNQDGRNLLRSSLIEYFNLLQSMGAIQNFTAEDVTVEAGSKSDSVIINCHVQPVDSVEKMYITVNL